MKSKLKLTGVDGSVLYEGEYNATVYGDYSEVCFKKDDPDPIRARDIPAIIATLAAASWCLFGVAMLIVWLGNVALRVVA